MLGAVQSARRARDTCYFQRKKRIVAHSLFLGLTSFLPTARGSLLLALGLDFLLTATTPETSSERCIDDVERVQGFSDAYGHHGTVPHSLMRRDKQHSLVGLIANVCDEHGKDIPIQWEDPLA